MVARADRVVLPGVGAFADCRRGLDAVAGMVEALEEAVRRKGRPFFGICVGMQLLAERGREYEVTEGLGWIAGEVDRITPADPNLKIPHMGWNTLNVARPHPLLDGLPLGPQGRHAYFVHSYQLNAGATRPISWPKPTTAAPVTAIVGRDNIVGTQFHPGEEPEARAGADREFPEVEAVILFPAIDLKNGECRAPAARRHGARDGVQPRSGGAGARLRGAGLRISPHRRSRRRLCRQADERAAVERILAAVKIPVQLGGGIRDRATIEAWLGKGVARVIIGTAAVRDPALVKEAARAHPGRVAVGLDARDGKVAVEGWAETSELIGARNRAALRGRRRRRHHLYRHRARRHAQGPQPRRHHRARR